MRRPTEAELEHATDLLARLAAIPDLGRNGAAIFRAEGRFSFEKEKFQALLRWEPRDTGELGDIEYEVRVELPWGTAEKQEKLRRMCRRRLDLALADRQDQLRELMYQATDEQEREGLAYQLYDEEEASVR
jgi:hypothetical protein